MYKVFKSYKDRNAISVIKFYWDLFGDGSEFSYPSISMVLSQGLNYLRIWLSVIIHQQIVGSNIVVLTVVQSLRNGLSSLSLSSNHAFLS